MIVAFTGYNTKSERVLSGDIMRLIDIAYCNDLACAGKEVSFAYTATQNRSTLDCAFKLVNNCDSLTC